MKARHGLEHIIFNSWKRIIKIKKRDEYAGKLVIGVSGGRDSMSLLHGLTQCLPKEHLIIVYCHHGPGAATTYRDIAAELVSDYCKRNNLIYESIVSEKDLKNEEEFREFRWTCFQSVCKRYQASIVVMAHHRDDWLENQLIKLIRGSSFASLRKNFQWAWVKDRAFYIWRPLIECRRTDIEAYHQQMALPVVEDPSNRESMYFRNWLRNSWLPTLEAKRPGSVNRLALSLINSIQDIKSEDNGFPWDFQRGSIDYMYFLSLSEVDKLRCLAYYIHSQGLRGIKSSQLKEIIKQLDKNGDRYHVHFKTFDCLVNAGQLFIQIH